jgi:hypothetical protein
MIYIYCPNAIIFILIWYILNINIFISLLLSPFIYIILSLILFASGRYQSFHKVLDFVKVLYYVEYVINKFLFWLFNQILKIDKINKLYLLVKVKIFLYFFKILAIIIPEKEENKLENELQNDYMEILNRNRKRTNNNEVT